MARKGKNMLTGELHAAGHFPVPSQLRFRRSKCYLHLQGNLFKVKSSCLVQVLQKNHPKCRDALQTGQNSNSWRLFFLFTLSRALLPPSSDLDVVFSPTEFKGKVHSWPRLQSSVYKIDLP